MKSEFDGLRRQLENITNLYRLGIQTAEKEKMLEEEVKDIIKTHKNKKVEKVWEDLEEPNATL